MTKRIQYFDQVKAYLIILVILGHVLNVINPGYAKMHFSVIQSFISAFHMPAFFITQTYTYLNYSIFLF